MKCPKCGADFEGVVVEDVEVDRCTQCHGLWFDVGEEERLKRIPGSELVDDGDPTAGRLHDGARVIQCPRDGASMMTIEDFDQPHIHYEVCPTCMGAFFDAGEFRDFKFDEVNLAELLKNIWR